MKMLAILPAAAAAVLALTSAAYSQPRCENEYTACMSTCASKSIKSTQDACFGNCENNNNMCAEKIYGKRPFNGAPSTAAVQKGPAKDALAKRGKQDAAKEEVAEDRAPQQGQAPREAEAAPRQEQAAPQPRQRSQARR